MANGYPQADRWYYLLFTQGGKICEKKQNPKDTSDQLSQYNVILFYTVIF